MSSAPNSSLSRAGAVGEHEQTAGAGAHYHRRPIDAVGVELTHIQDGFEDAGACGGQVHLQCVAGVGAPHVSLRYDIGDLAIWRR